MVDFTLEFRSGDRYDHGYDVPDEVIQQGEQAVKEYIVSQALDDILFVEIIDQY